MVKSKPLVSVLVPTKNSATYLRPCLASLKNQSYKNLEIIVIDNFSQDETLKIAKKFTNLVFQKGPERSAQLNFGAKKAKGKYLYRVDSDFVVDQDHIQNMVDKCEKEGLDAIATFNRSDPKNSFWAKVRNLERETYKDDDLILASRFFTKKAFEEVGGFDEELVAAEDYDLQNKLLQSGFKIGKVETADTHLGEPNSILKIAKESFYYGETLVRYFQKHPQRASKQFFPIRPSYLKNWKSFAENPVLTIGLIFMKLVMYASACSGFIYKKAYQPNLIFFLIFLIGLFLRLSFVNQKVMLFDESISLSLAKTDYLSLIRGILTDVHPPLYFVILKLWLNLQNSLEWARFLSVILGVIGLILTYFISRSLFNTRVAMLSTLVFSFSPNLIFDSTNARMYTLAQIFTLIIIYLFLRLINKPTPFLKISLAVVLLLGFLTHYYLLLILLPLNIVYWYYKKERKLDVFSWSLIQLSPLLLFAVTILTFLHPTSILPTNSLLKIPAVFTALAISWQGWLMGLYFPFGKTLFQSIPVYLLTLILFLLAIVSLKEKKYSFETKFLWMVFIFPLLLIFSVSFLIKPVFGVGSFTVFAPAFLLLVALGISNINSKIKRSAVLIFVIALSWIVLINQARDFLIQKEKMLQPIQYIKNNVTANDIVLHTDMTTYLPFRYQLKNDAQYLVFPFYFNSQLDKSLSINYKNLKDLGSKDKQLWYLDLSNSAKQKEIKEGLRFLKNQYDEKSKNSYDWYGGFLTIYFFQSKQ